MAQYKLGLRLPSLFEARYHQDPILRREPSNDAQYTVDLSAANGGVMQCADEASTRRKAREHR